MRRRPVGGLHGSPTPSPVVGFSARPAAPVDDYSCRRGTCATFVAKGLHDAQPSIAASVGGPSVAPDRGERAARGCRLDGSGRRCPSRDGAGGHRCREHSGGAAGGGHMPLHRRGRDGCVVAWASIRRGRMRLRLVHDALGDGLDRRRGRRSANTAGRLCADVRPQHGGGADRPPRGRRGAGRLLVDGRNARRGERGEAGRPRAAGGHRDPECASIRAQRA